MNLCLDLVLVQALAVVVEVVLHGVDHEVDEVVPPGLGVQPVLDALADGVDEELRLSLVYHGDLRQVHQVSECRDAVREELHQHPHVASE